MTDGAEQELIPVRPEIVSLATVSGPADVDVLADARAEAGSWSSNTRRAYVTGWKDFTRWCLENRCAGLPSAPADVGRYLEHLVETDGKALATARTRLAAITAAHRLGGHPDPASRPLVKATLKRLAREYGKPRKQAKGLTTARPWLQSRPLPGSSGAIIDSQSVKTTEKGGLAAMTRAKGCRDASATS